MPPDPLVDEDDQYASSEDSDFAPEDTRAATSDQSDSEDDAGQSNKRRGVEADAEDAGYDNSGDEAIIQKGNRRKRRKAKGQAEEEDEGGEGGLVKTRRQRAAEKEERRYAVNTEPVTVDVDALWAQMLAGKPSAPAEPKNTANGIDESTAQPASSANEPPTSSADDDPSALIRIKRTYNFAGRVHTEEKLVPRSSAEAKLFLASQGSAPLPETDALPAKRATKKAFRSAFEPLTNPLPQRADLNLGVAARRQAGAEARATKLNTVEKSRMDWAGYVDKEGIKDELELAGRSKQSYAAREDFLARSEARREDDARRARMAGRP